MNFGGTIHLNKIGLLLICGALSILFLYSSINRSTKAPSSNKISLNHLLNVAIYAAVQGGDEIKSPKILNNLKITSKGLTKEGLQDSVTTADFLSHCAMTAVLNRAFPHLKVVSEEAKTECDSGQNIKYYDDLNRVLSHVDKFANEEDLTVWIDPLDATHEYTEKLYDYVTTMVCVAEKGRPIIGVVHKPFGSAGETFWAWVGEGMSDNLVVGNAVPLNQREKRKIIVSRSHSGNVRDVVEDNLKEYEIVIAAGAGYKAVEVARENVDAYIHVTAIKKWDICAGNAILNAVGGRMSTKYNEIINYTDTTNVKNERGLIATKKDHELFVNKLNRT